MFNFAFRALLSIEDEVKEYPQFNLDTLYDLILKLPKLLSQSIWSEDRIKNN